MKVFLKVYKWHVINHYSGGKSLLKANNQIPKEMLINFFLLFLQVNALLMY